MKTKYKKSDFEKRSNNYRTDDCGNESITFTNQDMVNEIINSAFEYQLKEDFVKGTRLLARAIIQYPSINIFRERLGSILIEAEQFSEAIDVLEKIDDSEWCIRTFELMVIALERAKKFTELEDELSIIMSFGLESPVFTNSSGVLAYNKNKLEKAALLFEQAIQLDSGYGPAYLNKGLLKIEDGDVQEGLALIEEGFIKSSCNPKVSETYHSVISELGDYINAEKRFRQALHSFPNSKKLNYLYIDILVQQKKYTEALSAIQRVIANFGASDGILNPALMIKQKLNSLKEELSNKEPQISLCMIVKNEEERIAKVLYSVRGLVDEIIIVDTGSTDNSKDIATVFGAKIFDFSWNNNFADARNKSLNKAKGRWVFILDADEQISLSDHRKIKEMVKQGTDQNVAYSFITRNYVDEVGVEGWQANKGHYPEEKGKGWYPSVKVRLFPNKPSIRFENRLHEKVEKSLEKEGVKMVLGAVPVHHFGELDENRSQKKSAYYQLGHEKLTINENNLYSVIEHAIQAGEVGDYENAVHLWKTVLSKKSDYAKGFFNLGYAYIQLGKYKQGKRVSQKAIELDPDLKEAFLNLSLCEMRMGNVNNAKKILETFLTRYPDHPMALGTLGVAYCLSGQNEIGLQYLNEIVKMGYNSREFVQQHARALEATGKKEAALGLMNVSSKT